MRRSDQFEDILQRCLERLANGATIDECVREYPNDATELVPLLRAAQQLRGWRIPEQSAASRQAVRDRAHFALETQRAMQGAPRRGWWQHAGRMVWRYAAALVVIFSLFGTSVAAAQDDLPGDLLYNVKIGSEQVRVGLALSPLVRADLLLAFAQRRVDECLALQAAQRSIEGSLLAIQNEYARAWEAIGMVAPGERESLIQRYEESVVSQQAALTTALDTVPTGATRTTLEDIIQSMRDAQDRIQNLEGAPVPNATPEASATVAEGTPSPDASANTTVTALSATTTPTMTALTEGTPLIRTPTTRTPTTRTPRPGIITPTLTPRGPTPSVSQATATPRAAPTPSATSTIAPANVQVQPTGLSTPPPPKETVTVTIRLDVTVIADDTAAPAPETTTTPPE